jgi:hypothetical protein
MDDLEQPFEMGIGGGYLPGQAGILRKIAKLYSGLEKTTYNMYFSPRWDMQNSPEPDARFLHIKKKSLTERAKGIFGFARAAASLREVPTGLDESIVVLPSHKPEEITVAFAGVRYEMQGKSSSNDNEPFYKPSPRVKEFMENHWNGETSRTMRRDDLVMFGGTVFQMLGALLPPKEMKNLGDVWLDELTAEIDRTGQIMFPDDDLTP